MKGGLFPQNKIVEIFDGPTISVQPIAIRQRLIYVSVKVGCSQSPPNPITDAVIRVYDEAGNVIETREHKGDFKEW